MVWLQPLGASSLPLFDGAAFARDGVVMVTLEFRQLTFGNFAHPALTKEAKPDQPLARFQTMDLGYQMYTDSHEGAPARWIAGKASGGAPSYLDLFSYVRTRNRGKVRGAAHGDDITFVFDNWQKAAPQLQLSDEDRVATSMMHACWVNFAKTGKPSCEGVPDWPRDTTQGDQLMELGLTPRVRQHFRKPQLDAQEKAWRARADEAKKSVEDALRRLEESRLRPPN